MDPKRELKALDLTAWDNIKLEPRTEELSFVNIAEAMGVDSAAITVRGLTVDEINRAQRVGSKSHKLAAELASSLVNAKGKDAGEALQQLLGYGDDVDQVTAIEYEMVTLAIVSPEGMRLPQVVKLGEAFPIEFKQLVEAVNRLSGLGKQKAGSTTFGAPGPAKMPSPSPT